MFGFGTAFDGFPAAELLREVVNTPGRRQGRPAGHARFFFFRPGEVRVMIWASPAQAGTCRHAWETKPAYM